ncbi:DUF2911 domain-containing protein [Candidatus Omnitrophota bacterium]
MNRTSIVIGMVVVLTILLSVPSTSFAQDKPRPSLNASVTQRLGIDTDITISYCRPGVKGRKIWGDLVPYGLAPGNKYSDNKPYPWRAGANENTTIETSKDILIEGKKLPAGKYSIHMIPSETTWVIAFNKKNDLWGSYKYNKAEDAFRITVTPVAIPHKEWMTFGFGDLAGTSATAALCWEKLKVPFKIEVAK